MARPALPSSHPAVHIAALTFQGFNERDSIVALGLFSRVKRLGWRVTLCGPEAGVTSMNAVTVQAQPRPDAAPTADAGLVGRGRLTREVVADAALMAQLQPAPRRPAPIPPPSPGCRRPTPPCWTSRKPPPALWPSSATARPRLT